MKLIALLLMFAVVAVYWLAYLQQKGKVHITFLEKINRVISQKKLYEYSFYGFLLLVFFTFVAIFNSIPK